MGLGPPTMPEGVFSKSAATAYKTIAFVASLIVLGVVLGWGAGSLIGSNAEAKPEKPTFGAAADLQALKSSLDALRLQTAETAAKVERLDDRVREVQIDVGALKAASERRR